MASIKRSGRFGSRSGMTLVEVMIGITVATVAVLGSMASESVVTKLNRTSHQTNRAMADLQTAMEELLLLGVDDIPTQNGCPPGQSIPEFDDLHLAGESIVATYPNYDGGTVPDPLEVVLTATWNDEEGTSRSVSITCLKTR